MKIAVIAPFFNRENLDGSVWIDHFVRDEGFAFKHVPRQTPMPKWHDRKSKLTPPVEWVRYIRQAADAFKTKPEVVVSVFPQLAACAGLLGRFNPDTKVLAWMFNVGTCHSGYRQWVSRIALSNIDRFVVHTRREIKIYSDWLGLPQERFVFVPYQSPEIDQTVPEDEEAPFISAMGSAHRDYRMLARILHDIQLPTTIASSHAALDGIDLPDCVQTPFGISKQECLEITQRARVNVIPLLPKPAVTAAGQVTLVEAMFMGKVLVATEYYGVEDYLQHEKTGLLVKPHDEEGFKAAILRLWNDKDLRVELAENSRRYAREHFSDQAAGRALEQHLKELQQPSIQAGEIA
ncbi:MAG: glycosyltransferase [Pseudomonadota bacterium]